jgi:hypothetical protein
MKIIQTDFDQISSWLTLNPLKTKKIATFYTQKKKINERKKKELKMAKSQF